MLLRALFYLIRVEIFKYEINEVVVEGAVKHFGITKQKSRLLGNLLDLNSDNDINIKLTKWVECTGTDGAVRNIGISP